MAERRGFIPTKRRGGCSVSHTEWMGEVTKSFEVVLTQNTEVLAILKVGRKKFPHL